MDSEESMKNILIKMLGAGLLTATAGIANATIIDFEGFNDGDAIGTIGDVTFSSTGGVEIFAFGGDFASSGVNTIAGDNYGFNDDLYVDFLNGVSDLSFYSGGDDNSGQQAQINVFTGGSYAATLALLGDGNANTVDWHDLSAYANITRIEIFNVTDTAGLVYDDFEFVSVPEPATVALFLMGLAGIRLSRKKGIQA
jgi:hypothetical protein